eukprot:SAG11_NODE_1493_length_4805_cov_14.583510_4_plen_90_part_00
MLNRSARGAARSNPRTGDGGWAAAAAAAALNTLLGIASCASDVVRCPAPSCRGRAASAAGLSADAGFVAGFAAGCVAGFGADFVAGFMK